MGALHYFPKNYRPLLSLEQTEKAIADIKSFFQTYLSAQLRLRRVTAPLFVQAGTGVNDDLNGIEKPISFKPRGFDDGNAEIVQSLAKWKRLVLADYRIPVGYGLYTDMNAIRPDEEPDNLHSYYVDQWDWERTITREDRSLDFLKSVVRKIYATIVSTEFLVYESFPDIPPVLPEEIAFIHAEELLARYPDLPPLERENRAAREHGAVFVIGIGGALSDGRPHDGRAPDYDDWSTLNSDGYAGLNGDILVWNPVLERVFELSSMGIRVDEEALLRQLQIRGLEERTRLLFHKRLLAGELPQSMGGGIGQSRLCMFFLRKAHIGEVQASLWPPSVSRDCAEHGIRLM